MIDFQKTEPNRKPNSLTAVNRKGHFLKFLSEIWDKIRGNSTISVGFVKKTLKPSVIYLKLLLIYGLSTFRPYSKNVGFCLKIFSTTTDG